ncbi:MAG: biotin synthase BioB [bacterium]|nr:biotin synthase BioB [bacterium]
MAVFLQDLRDRIINEGYRINRIEAERIAHVPEQESMLLFHYAQQLRKHFRGDVVGLCAIVNAKSGACSEDCAFCAQSAHFETGSPVYALISPEEAVERAKVAKNDGAKAFGIVISGLGIKRDGELKRIGEIVKRIRREVDIEVHGSFGVLDREKVEYLRHCGVSMIHHNLETSERHFANICTTHTYQDRVETIRAAASCGMPVCGGGIFGMGETLEDRVDMAFELRGLGVSVTPMNFLHAIDGTPLEKQTPMTPIECLMTVALFRFIMPDKEIKVCGGRESNLRDLQSMIFFAGADSMMIGNYLTTAGREPELDYQMMRDLGLRWE